MAEIRLRRARAAYTELLTVELRPVRLETKNATW
jgi:hypothetical protein